MLIIAELAKNNVSTVSVYISISAFVVSVTTIATVSHCKTTLLFGNSTNKEQTRKYYITHVYSCHSSAIYSPIEIHPSLINDDKCNNVLPIGFNLINRIRSSLSFSSAYIYVDVCVCGFTRAEQIANNSKQITVLTNCNWTHSHR